MVAMTEREVAIWLAGLLDGEGYIGLVNRTPEIGRQHFRSYTTVAGTDLRLMDALQERTRAGRVYKHKRTGNERTKKLAYTWRLTAEEQRKWLPRVLPFLVIKKEQAEALLRALELKDQLRFTKGFRITAQTRDDLAGQISEIYLELRQLNRKGPPPEVVAA